MRTEVGSPTAVDTQENGAIATTEWCSVMPASPRTHPTNLVRGNIEPPRHRGQQIAPDF